MKVSEAIDTLTEMDEFLANVADDVARLQAKVAELGDTVPAEVAAAVSDLHDRMAAVKDVEPDAPVV